MFAKGGQKLKNFVDDIWKKIADWFLKNKEIVKGWIDRIKKAFSKDSKTDELFRDISKKFIVNNNGVLSKTQFLKIATQIEKHFGTKLHWIDRNSYEFRELFKKWQEEPIFAVFHSSTFKNGRYGIVLDGPAIYFFEGIHKFGNKISITAYTLQHELIHLKLWYKMTKEFPELIGLYRKIPRWLDEANVIGEILKQNAQKFGKWDLIDIENDLTILNNMLRKNPLFKKEAQRILGKEQLQLKDFENWDLRKFLEKL
ncbi:hypothetical protein [Chryseobacterium sp.]|uniref:hypothetical protein n=1 Tax=Chryseobacterium sp. TaxID=1871047 RepID=UPI0011C7A778|nr:hypothetical protein [Chryseobacterium sp.]TXF79493.1 hypothetical protein FUA25_03675 [Chryseobacterium sp.]